MRIVITPRELSSSIKMQRVLFSEMNQLKKDLITPDMFSRVSDLEELLRSTQGQAVSATDVATLNERFSLKDGFAHLYFDHEKNMVIQYDEQKYIQIMDVLTQDVPTMTGFFITVYGMSKIVGATVRRTGERILSIIQSK